MTMVSGGGLDWTLSRYWALIGLRTLSWIITGTTPHWTHVAPLGSLCQVENAQSRSGSGVLLVNPAAYPTHLRLTFSNIVRFLRRSGI
jgi:hypothetical protein